MRETSTKPPTFGILAYPQDSKAPNEPPRKTPGESTESHRALAAKIILDVVSAVASEDVSESLGEVLEKVKVYLPGNCIPW